MKLEYYPLRLSAPPQAYPPLQLIAGAQRLYGLELRARQPQPQQRRTPVKHAVHLTVYDANGNYLAARDHSLADIATWLVQLPLDLDEIEGFYAAARLAGWEESLLLAAMQAANAAVTVPPPPTYLVVKLEGGVITEHEYLPQSEAQLAVASHCDRDVTELQCVYAIPGADVYSATDDSGDRDAWAFPVAASGSELATLAARLAYSDNVRWTLWEQLKATIALLHAHNLPWQECVTTTHLLTDCPYCGSPRTVVVAHDDLDACIDCGRAWLALCPECEGQNLTWKLEREFSPTGFVTRQWASFVCACGHTWTDGDEEENRCTRLLPVY